MVMGEERRVGMEDAERRAGVGLYSRRETGDNRWLGVKQEFHQNSAPQRSRAWDVISACSILF